MILQKPELKITIEDEHKKVTVTVKHPDGNLHSLVEELKQSVMALGFSPQGVAAAFGDYEDDEVE